MRLLVFILALVISATSSAHAERRVALVIGNAAYKNVATLQNPRNDANDIASSLTRLNFSVSKVIDGTFEDMRRALRKFGHDAAGADMAVIYYSGHGMEIGGENWLIPVDAELESDRDPENEAIALKSAMYQVANGSSLGLVILDACRNNPFATKMQRSVRTRAVDRGLVRVEPSDNVLVAYAAREGTIASDGDGRHSPFTTALLNNLETPGLEINFLFRNVRDEVLVATKREQQPFIYGSLSKQAIYLKESEGKAQDAAPSSQSVQTEAAQAWAATQGTTDQAVLEDFIRRYGGTFYGTLAWARLDELKKSQEAAAPATVAQPPKPVENTQVAVIAPPVKPANPCSSQATTVGIARFAQPLSAREECALKPGNVFTECDRCPEMVVIPAGSFTMGSPSNEPERAVGEAQVRVTIAQPFAVGEYAVTFYEWDACVEDGGCDGYNPSHNWTSGRSPVTNVSWNDAQKYIEWLNRKTGKTYRLLSEAEREYVTRAGTTTPFWWGLSITPKQANYEESSASVYNAGSKGEHRMQTIPVDSFSPNPWGLYGVHGNAWEWTQDCWNESNSGNPGDGSSRTSGDCDRRVIRGGSWNSPAWDLRAATRGFYSTVFRSTYLGFRVARTLTP